MPLGVCTWKKPLPSIATSSGLPVWLIDPSVKSYDRLLVKTPWPGDPAAPAPPSEAP